MNLRLILPLVIATTGLLSAATADAAVAVSASGSSSVLLPGFTTVGTRHREFESTVRSGNDLEHFLGRNDLGGHPNRVSANHLYVLGDNVFELSLSGGTLQSVMNGNTLQIGNVFNWAGAAADQPFDTLQFSIRDGAVGNGLIALNGLTISGMDFGGNSVSNMMLGDFAGVDGGGFQYWNITGLDFRQDFIFSGILSLTTPTGAFSGSSELNRVEFTLGNGPVEQGVVPESATWAMLIVGFGLVGSAMRRRRIPTVSA